VTGRAVRGSTPRRHLINRLRGNDLLRHAVYRLGRTRAQRLVDQVEPYLSRTDRILDLGCGTCNVAEVLTERGYGPSTLLDVEDFSFVESLKPELYDGSVIPHEAERFDVVLLITVLHHTPAPEQLLREAARVAKRVIVVEDVYSSFAGMLSTKLMDSVSNLEFVGHPHSNKSDQAWKRCFSELQLTLVHAEYSRFWKVFTSAAYDLRTEVGSS
jgi:ubiquinone/menaquinone biosynthesis C-methylase UbiE